MSDIRTLQLEELSILKEFVRVCEEHNLRYYLLGGTLLGAVRHEGFIPWDDDVDVCMPREDMNKLLNMPKDVFREGFKIENYTNVSDYRYSWPRLTRDKVKIINRSANIPREENAWIDIIPLDGFPDKAFPRLIHKTKLSFWWNLNQILQYDELVDQKRKRGRLGSFAVKAAGKAKYLGKIIDYRSCLKHLNRQLMKYPYESDTNEVINYLAAYGFKEIFPRASIGKGGKLKFEDCMLTVPEDYRTVCEIIYGDTYMQLPPLSERNKHNSEIIYIDSEKEANADS